MSARPRALLILALCAGTSVPADAAVHRCTGADGKTYFTDNVCGSERVSHELPPLSEPHAATSTVQPAAPPPSAAAATPVAADEPDPADLHNSLIKPSTAFTWLDLERWSGVLMLCISPIWLIRIAFREDRMWGLALLFGKGSGLFTLIHPGVALPPTLLFLAGLSLLLVPTHPLLRVNLSQDALTPCDTRLSPQSGKAVAPFPQAAGVCLSSTLQYKPTQPDQNGKFTVEPRYVQPLDWRWCKGRVPRGGECESLDNGKDKIDLREPGPHSVIGQYRGPWLKPGAYTVQLVIDDELADSVEFDVVQQ